MPDPQTTLKTPQKKLVYQRELMRKLRAQTKDSALQHIEVEVAKKLGEQCDNNMKMDFDTVWPIILEAMGEYRYAKA